ncbi:pilus biogenesis protein [Stutzerimonas stutzeri DSM 10701]|uniref:O-antigen ligase family protein n=1 Tax=Stutzerimonas nitrititolerans TaxID=2482751 RepID=UPI00026D7636|nr:O-antigen ligase family protein [Stutzerimonas nitrititolerans]AFN76864.1 pilus biogenesis protein [Stutzerimonas stutzeri DSM 10701]
MFFLKDKKMLILAFFILVFSSTSLSYWLLDYSWLEQQRITQLLLVFSASTALLLGYLRDPSSFAPPGNAVLLAFVLGLASALLSQHPQWALKEWAKYASSFAMIAYLGHALRQTAAQQVVLFILLITSAMLAVQFFSFYVASFFTGTRDVNPYLMYPGFDNPRFYGQFQIMLIPILHGLSFQQGWHKKLFNQNVIYLALLLQWCIVWALAGRGVVLGLCAACVITLLATGARYKALLLQVLVFAMAGAVLYFLLFFCIPEWAGLGRDIPSSLRFGLSKRDVLWLGAWEMIQAHPLLGVGPLHYSAVWNHIGAHPHQATLQFLAEWGIPATLLFLFSIMVGMSRGMNRIRNNTNTLDAALWIALLASLTLAQVDGVLVMPYTEGWLAVISGLALARWRSPARVAATAVSVQRGIFSILLLLAMAIIANILIMDVPVLHETSIKFYEENNIGSPPRFWDQGWIPM